jgi:hypothetical protein
MEYILGTGLTMLGVNFLFKNIERFAPIPKDFTFFGGKQNNDTNESDKNYYFEFKRLNLTFGKYPPGFNLSYEAQQIFDFLDSKGLLNKYKDLINTYSVLLCQKYHSSYKDCDPDMLEQRIKDIKGIVSTKFNKNDIIEKNKYFFLYDKSRISKLILYSLEIINRNIEKLDDDYLTSLNRKICLNHLHELQTLCSL